VPEQTLLPLPAPVALLRNATLPDGEIVDVAVDGATVGQVGPAGSLPAPGGQVLDLTGYLLLPAAAEPHAHLDKALTFDRIRPAQSGLRRAIESFHAYAAVEDAPSIADRARRTLLRMLASGITAVRSHVNAFPGEDPLVAVRALTAVRDEFAGLLDLELVALPSEEVSDEWIEAALDLGVDLVGGAPHLSTDPLADLTRLLDLAERRGAGVDLHADEGLDGPLTLLAYAERVRDWPVSKSAGHCVRLGTLPLDERAEVVAAIAAADIGVISLPITNLYLQGWETPVATPRGLTALRALLDAGVRVAGGADNVRDPFNPLGRCDPLETAALLVSAGHLTLEESLDAVTNGARSVLHLPPAGPVPGAAADLLAVRADTVGEAIAFASPDRYVLHAGRLVAVSSLTSRVAVPATASDLSSPALAGAPGREARG
jgi:cytosine/creatinine deaminase